MHVKKLFFQSIGYSFADTQKKVTTTPLLEYLKQRKQEKQRLKDEKREERRRRDLERRRAKDELTISKVINFSFSVFSILQSEISTADYFSKILSPDRPIYSMLPNSIRNFQKVISCTDLWFHQRNFRISFSHPDYRDSIDRKLIKRRWLRTLDSNIVLIPSPSIVARKSSVARIVLSRSTTLLLSNRKRSSSLSPIIRGELFKSTRPKNFNRGRSQTRARKYSTIASRLQHRSRRSRRTPLWISLASRRTLVRPEEDTIGKQRNTLSSLDRSSITATIRAEESAKSNSTGDVEMPVLTVDTNVADIG